MEQVDPLHPIKTGFPMMGMSVTKGYSEIAKGRLKVVKNYGRTFVRASEINRYIAMLEAETQADLQSHPEKSAA